MRVRMVLAGAAIAGLSWVGGVLLGRVQVGDDGAIFVSRTRGAIEDYSGMSAESKVLARKLMEDSGFGIGDVPPGRIPLVKGCSLRAAERGMELRTDQGDMSTLIDSGTLVAVQSKDGILDFSPTAMPSGCRVVVIATGHRVFVVFVESDYCVSFRL